MKNITLSADEKLIEQARKNAVIKGSTLNQEFRTWLESQAVSGETRSEQYRQHMKRLTYVNAGRKFTRQEMNER